MFYIDIESSLFLIRMLQEHNLFILIGYQRNAFGFEQIKMLELQNDCNGRLSGLMPIRKEIS